MNYIAKLQKIKEERGLTLVEISKISNLPLTTVTRIFNGQTPNPSFETVSQIAIALGTSLDELAGLKTPDPTPVAAPVVAALDSYAELIKEKDERIRELKEEKEKMREEKEQVRKEKHRVALGLACVVAFMLVLLTIDVMNGHFGYFRY